MEKSKTTEESLTPIAPIVRRIQGLTGIWVEYAIESITKPEYICSARTKEVQHRIEDAIMERLFHHPEGSLTFDQKSSPVDIQPQAYYVIGVRYYTAPDYQFIARIFGWLYNFSPSEALTVEDFQRAYGPALGEHIYSEKWRGWNMDITKMIGYFGTDYKKGQKFFNLIMEKVVLYEKRCKDTDRWISKEPFERAASFVSGDRQAEELGTAAVDELQGKAGNGAPGSVKANPCRGAVRGTAALTHPTPSPKQPRSSSRLAEPDNIN